MNFKVNVNIRKRTKKLCTQFYTTLHDFAKTFLSQLFSTFLVCSSGDSVYPQVHAHSIQSFFLTFILFGTAVMKFYFNYIFVCL